MRAPFERIARASLFSIAMVVALASSACERQQKESGFADRLQARVDELQSANPSSPGFAISFRTADGRIYNAATGVADPDQTPFTPNTRLRIASITKTFVAATVLRLWEDGLLDLDSSISAVVDPEIIEKLSAEGYDVEAITVLHLLTHTSGMAEHTTDAYLGEIAAAPGREWTRMGQIDMLVDGTEPVGAPLEKFSYSDTGYILLGDIIERVTGEPLPAVVRKEMKFEEIGLGGVWWDALESTQDREKARAHQHYHGEDIYDWHGTIDAFGGGGLIASTADIALFFAALFEGEIFNKAETLELMLASLGNPFADQYRIGVFPRTLDGTELYGHSGFWGTVAFYAPELNIAVAGASLESQSTRDLRIAMDEMLIDLRNAKK